MKLTTITNVSVDGVMQGLGGPDEDRRGGFERGDPRWADTTVLSGGLAAAVGELKAKPAGELQVHGSGSLVRWLLDNQLVDEITLLTYPVVVGQGTRLFPGTGPDTALDLAGSRATPGGVTIQVYRPTGRPQYATATPTPST
jgi:dihydrofolate reductase